MLLTDQTDTFICQTHNYHLKQYHPNLIPFSLI
nr:MAG TPA: hypothetical protein [Caudoviricetes sp.]